MPGTITPAQMFDHMLNIRKGWFNITVSLDKAATKDPNYTFNPGIVAHIDPNSALMVPGLPDDYMPIYLRQGSASLDVDGDVGNFIANAVAGVVATGGFELSTTEFVTDTYLTNDPLRCNNTVTNLGKVEKGTYYVDTICGVVSKNGPITNKNSRQELWLWTYFLPKYPGLESSSSSEEPSSESSEESSSSSSEEPQV